MVSWVDFILCGIFRRDCLGLLLWGTYFWSEPLYSDKTYPHSFCIFPVWVYCEYTPYILNTTLPIFTRNIFLPLYRVRVQKKFLDAKKSIIIDIGCISEILIRRTDKRGK